VVPAREVKGSKHGPFDLKPNEADAPPGAALGASVLENTDSLASLYEDALSV
jgi:hypothetical protein